MSVPPRAQGDRLRLGLTPIAVLVLMLLVVLVIVL
jgi:hypothetical protein